MKSSISAFITSFEALRSGVSEYGFSLIRIFPHKDEIVDSVLIREHTDQRNAIFWHILCSEFLDDALKLNAAIHLRHCSNDIETRQLTWFQYDGNIVC